MTAALKYDRRLFEEQLIILWIESFPKFRALLNLGRQSIKICTDYSAQATAFR